LVTHPSLGAFLKCLGNSLGILSDPHSPIGVIDTEPLGNTRIVRITALRVVDIASEDFSSETRNSRGSKMFCSAGDV
jgi:hypothetical protein